MPQPRYRRVISALAILAALFCEHGIWVSAAPPVAGSRAAQQLEQAGFTKGICVVLGLPETGSAESVLALTAGNEGLFYFQSPDRETVAAVRRLAIESSLLGRRLFVEQGGWKSIHLAENLADVVLVAPELNAHV